MPYSVTLLPSLWQYRVWLVLVLGCTLGLLDCGQAAIAQTISAADFVAPNLATPNIALPNLANSNLAAPTQAAMQTVLLVDPVAGNDAVADGSDRAPFRTITQALQVAQAGAVILLSPGIYSQESGEQFPLRLKPDVTVQGNPETRGQAIVIQGSGFFLSPTFARQKVAIVGADRAILAGVTVKNPDAQGYGVWVESTSPAILDNTFTASGHDGISVTGSGSPLIRNNYFYQNGANGITLYGTSQAEVRENIFEQTGFAININQKAMPLLIGNRITQNKDGIVVQASAQPILRNNSVDGNTRDGLVAIAQSRPNLGTAAAPGGNSFRNNGQFDVNAQASSQQLPAFGNDLVKTTGNLDLAGTSLEAAAASSGSPMPWSGLASPSSSVGTAVVGNIARSTALQSPASADKSTATGGKLAAPKRPLVMPVPSIAVASQTTADTIPFGQRLVGDQVSRVEPSTVALASSESGLESGFPVPSALTGAATNAPPPQPVQVVSMATAPQRPLPSPSNPGADEPNRALPVVTVRPISQRQWLPIVRVNAITSPPIISRTIISRTITSPNQLSPVPVMQSSSSRQTGAIDIPVPAPERRSLPIRSTAVTPIITRSQMTSSTAFSSTSAGLLPVPNPDAPIGNVGNASIVYRNQQLGSSTRGSSAGFTSRAALGLRYRVVVSPADNSQQARLQTAFPNAFRTFIKGRSLIQVGAFGDRGKADQLTQTLSSQGVEAMVETVE